MKNAPQTPDHCPYRFVRVCRQNPRKVDSVEELGDIILGFELKWRHRCKKNYLPKGKNTTN